MVAAIVFIVFRIGGLLHFLGENRGNGIDSRINARHRCRKHGRDDESCNTEVLVLNDVWNQQDGFNIEEDELARIIGWEITEELRIEDEIDEEVDVLLAQYERQIVQLENRLSILLGRNPGPVQTGESLEDRSYEMDMPISTPVELEFNQVEKD